MHKTHIHSYLKSHGAAQLCAVCVVTQDAIHVVAYSDVDCLQGITTRDNKGL